MKNRAILERLAVLKQKECIHKEFNFTFYHCGTAGCLAGELVGLDNKFYFAPGEFTHMMLRHRDIDSVHSHEVLMTYFNLPEDAIEHIFVPYEQDTEKYGGEVLHGFATLEEVQANLKIFLAKYMEPAYV